MYVKFGNSYWFNILGNQITNKFVPLDRNVEAYSKCCLKISVTGIRLVCGAITEQYNLTYRTCVIQMNWIAATTIRHIHPIFISDLQHHNSVLVYSLVLHMWVPTTSIKKVNLIRSSVKFNWMLHSEGFLKFHSNVTSY